MKKTPFVTLEKAQEIISGFDAPFTQDGYVAYLDN